MKVSVKELAEVLSQLPDVKSYSGITIEKVVKYYSDKGIENEELQVILVFDKTPQGDAWNMYMPTRHANPIMDDPHNLPS